MIRVTLGSPLLADLPEDCAGAHGKLLLPDPGEALAAFERRLDGEGEKPVTRTYTVRHARPTRHEMDVDFVAHNKAGPASAWALAVRPGDFCAFAGPATAKLVDPRADWYLIAADMSALPAAAATLEALPRDAIGVAVFEITDEADRQVIDAPVGIAQHWLLHTDPHRSSDAQARLVRNLAWPDGRVQTMIAGESGAVRELRTLVRRERGVAKEDAYASGYWQIGLHEDAHQKIKREQNEADERVLTGGSA